MFSSELLYHGMKCMSIANVNDLPYPIVTGIIYYCTDTHDLYIGVSEEIGYELLASYTNDILYYTNEDFEPQPTKIKSWNCPNCGGGVQVSLKYKNYAFCPYCDSTLRLY